MRIDRLDLIAFGPFTDATLDLSGGEQGLHLVFGPNEAGKSSTLRAIQQLFGGIPTKSSDDFVHAYAGMRIGALIRSRAGETIEMVRRKGTKNTLLKPDGKPLDEERLTRLLGVHSAADFLRKFVIDHAELVAGGQELVDGRGDLGQSLFAAGSGIAGLGPVQKALDEQAEALYKRGGSKPAINARVAEIEAERKRIKEQSLKSTEWVEHDRALSAARERKGVVEGELDLATRRRDHLKRVKAAIEPLGRRTELTEELRTLSDAPRLPRDFAHRHLTAISFLKPSERAEAEAVRRIEELVDALDALDVPEGLLDQAEGIESAYRELGRQRQGAVEDARLESERKRLLAEAEIARRDLGYDREDPPRPKPAERAAVEALAADRPTLLRDRDDAEAALKKHRSRRSEATAKLAGLGPERDPGPLRLALKQANALGDFDADLRKGREALAVLRRRAEAKLAALGLWEGSLEGIEALAAPAVEALERARERRDGLEGRREEVRRKRLDLEARVREADARLEELRLSGDIPTESALDEARADREAQWLTLKASRAWDEATGSRFEGASRRADALADRLRREANRVADLARAQAERMRWEAEGKALVSEDETNCAAFEAELTAWLALWKPVGIDAPQGPREMLAWLRKQGELAAMARGVREAEDALRVKEEQGGVQRAALDQALGEEGLEDEGLARRIDRAEAVLEANRKATAEREGLVERLEALDRDRAALEEATERARGLWERWEGDWSGALARLRLGSGALPAEALAVLARTAELFERLDRAEEHARKRAEIAAESASFAGRVRGLAGRVAIDLVEAGFEAEAAAAELFARLTRARASRQKREDLEARLVEQREIAQGARATIAEQRGQLEALRALARCERDEDLPGVEERSSRRQKLEAELTTVNAALRALAGSSSFEGFLTEAALADLDGLGPEIARLDGLAATLEEERGRLDQTIGGESTRLALWDGSGAAADADQNAESLRARVKADVEQYARLKIAAAVLRTGIERYRNKAQGPLLDRASTLFGGLTLGSFERLRIDYDDRDQPVLKGVRPGGLDVVGVEGMSLGTADQLYLALRLAALETSLDPREPLPLVVDDVLIQFDNLRALATLRALAELSRQTQVIVFTHHEHLVELARTHLPASTLHVHAMRASNAIAGPATS